MFLKYLYSIADVDFNPDDGEVSFPFSVVYQLEDGKPVSPKTPEEKRVKKKIHHVFPFN